MSSGASGRTVRWRAGEAADGPAINRAFNEVFAQTRALADWEWKFQPPDGSRILLALDEDGAVLAHFAALEVRLQAGGRLHRVGQAVDIFAAREGAVVRERVFPRTVAGFYRDAAAAGWAALVGLPGERHLELGRLRLGYVAPRPVAVWRRQAGGWRRRWSGHQVRAGFDAAAVDLLWRRAAPRYPVAAVRDGAWLARRFTGRPGVEYLHFAALRRGSAGASDRIAAWGVLRCEGGLGRWAELIWDGSDPLALAALDGACVEAAAARGAAELELWLQGDTAAESALAALGWERGAHPQGLQLTAVALDCDLDCASLVEGYYLTMGDSDLV